MKANETLETGVTEAGYGYLIQRNSELGILLGYVEVPSGHPCSGRSYDETPVEVHGGLSYSNKAPNGDGWRFGFDLGHAGDAIPALGLNGRDWTVPDVREECERLAVQLKALETGHDSGQ